MKLTQEEKFVLAMLFNSDSEFDISVRNQLDDAQVIERSFTGAGFFSTVQFLHPLSGSEDRFYRDWNFDHRKLKHGGSFMAWYKPLDLIELECVTWWEDSWPTEFDSEMFSEAK